MIGFSWVNIFKFTVACIALSLAGTAGGNESLLAGSRDSRANGRRVHVIVFIKSTKIKLLHLHAPGQAGRTWAINDGPTLRRA